MKRFRKVAIALSTCTPDGTTGNRAYFVQAKEAIEDVQKNADFSRPEALTEEEAGITDSTSGEQDKSQQSDADVQNETTPSEDTETQEEQDNSSGRNRRKSAGKRSGVERTTGLLSDSRRTGR